MSNERIDQILEDTIPFFRANEERSPHYADLIRKAMEQYGKEQYASGYLDSEKKNEVVQSCANSIADDNRRLQALVQAQKELIEFLRTYVPFAERDVINSNYNHFLNKIKELEA